jgi:hypothetical protein
MKTKLLLTSIAAFFLAAFIGGCKDENVETVGLCPLVVSTTPANLAINVPLQQVITVTFNEAMNPETITPASFDLTTPSAGGRTSAATVPGVLTYNAATFTMTFTPSVKLSASTTYGARVFSTVKDLMGNALQLDYVWTFSTGATVSPTVISTGPANNATAITLNRVVDATFSVPMNAATIIGTTFTITQGATSIPGVVSYNAATATASFTPNANLTANTVYTGTITTGAMNVPGTKLAANYVWTFTTGVTVAPTVISTDPLNLAIGIPLNQVISATFNEAMDPLTITSSSFTIKNGATVVAGTVTYSGTKASFTPSVNLSSGTTYTATVTTAAKNIAGIPLVSDKVWTFTTITVPAPTVTSTDPLDLATGVALNKIISATFSEAMNSSTITSSSFTLTLGGTLVAGTVSYAGTTATFTPSSNLLSGNTYTATITTAAKNPSGVSLASNKVWTFNTVSPLGPLAPDMKSVARFGIIAGVGVSNNAGFSEIRNLDVGISPGVRSSITGFPPAIIVNGAMYASDDIAPAGVPAMLTQAKADLTAVYLFAEGATSPAPAIVAGDQGGLTLAPGIYKSTSTLLIQSGDLTLDAQGDANAVWIFQIASDFTTVGGAGGSVILSGGAQAKNVYWQVGSSATIGNSTTFKGNVLALTSITMNSGAVAAGRMLARNGSVVMTNTNIIDKP